MKMEKTGHYRCVAENRAGSANQTATIGVIPSSRSAIIVICVSCLCFIVAIIINSVNLTVYLLDHLKKQKRKRMMHSAVTLKIENLEEKKEEEWYAELQQNKHLLKQTKSLSSISCPSNQQHQIYDGRSEDAEGVDDSKCQQLFLDTVVKGAHTVKKTLHDAKNSEFSTNMAQYASNLRDRMHIDLPSTSFQLPNISMPTIPTMQNINSNIERIGSSALRKSHNIATSVGSVLTLKRWTAAQQQQQQQQPRSSTTDDDEAATGEEGDKIQSDEGSTSTEYLKKKEVPIEQHEQSDRDNEDEKEDNPLLKL